MATVEIQYFFDPVTSTLTYVIFDPASRDAVIVDPVLDFDLPSGVLSTSNIQKVAEFIDRRNLSPRMVIETHAHADHLSSSQWIKDRWPQVLVGISSGIRVVQETFKELLELNELATNGEQFDLLFADQEFYEAGSLTFKVLHTPGHTPACASFLFAEKHLFVGDLLFMPDFGTGRCDFPHGSAALMYESVTSKIYQLPGTTQVYFGHDYQPNGRELRYTCTVADLQTSNIHINAKVSRNEFVGFREQRDKTLSAPRLLYPSIQFNINAGQAIAKGNGDRAFFKLPVSLTIQD